MFKTLAPTQSAAVHTLARQVGSMVGWALFPGRCHLCLLPSDRPRDLCHHCQAALPWQWRACPLCGLGRTAPGPPGADAAPRLVDHPSAAGPVCSACARGRRALPHCRGAVAPLAYTGLGAWLVQQQKRHGGRVAGRLLAELLADAVLLAAGRQALPWPDALLPVPLHPWRQWRRGFNQAEHLADWLGRRLALPCRPSLARRQRRTRSQLGLGVADRQRNLRGAFVAAPEVRGRHLAIVDDVLTTGATASSLARALRAAGAASVQVWCATRALAAEPDAG